MAKQNMEQWIQALSRAERSSAEFIKESIVTASIRAVLRAKTIVGVKKGWLRDSIRIRKFERKSGSFKGGINAWSRIAHLQEYGTINHPPHPFMRPAVDAELPQFGEDLIHAAHDAFLKSQAADAVTGGGFSFMGPKRKP